MSVLEELHSRLTGLTDEEVKNRQKKYGLNVLERQHPTILSLFIRQVTGNPLTIILAIATIISYSLGQQVSSYYIFAIILVSILLGFWNEFAAEKTVDGLLKKITARVLVIRNGRHEEIPVANLTIGDIVFISEGTIIPSDMRLLEVKELEINESILTGESKTVYKTALPKKDAKEAVAYMGTSVVSGWGKGVVIAVAKETEYGKIAREVAFIKPVTQFQKGLMQFGQLILRVILILTLGIFLINAFVGHSLLESLLFSLAIAVGLTPELLPVIVTISLSHGAGKLAKKHVVAKQLIAIENLGNMDILCTDKTGTLTEGLIHLTDYADTKGQRSSHILSKALITLPDEKSSSNAIDTSLRFANHEGFIKPYEAKVVDQEPFNYERRLSYTVVEHEGKNELIVRGSPEAILGISHKNEILAKKFVALQKNGQRVIVIASKFIKKKQTYEWDDCTSLSIDGYLTFLDEPKKGVKEALRKLLSLGVQVKILTGDSDLVTKKICQEVGLSVETILTGQDIIDLSEEALGLTIEKTTIFARLSPDQKLHIVQLLQKKGHAVGYLGDGVNDLPTLHAADVGISVNTATDVAKDAASIVLLRKNLHVIVDGIIEGRKTFHNTIKYILMATSSNFGNMFSAAGASFFLSFLPMTPVQILLTNGLYDMSQTAIPSDNVDLESLLRPRQWDISFLKNYMIFFGPISSFFDFLTFGIMIFIFHANTALFQTGWFVESLATEILVIFIIRTSRSPFFLSRPSWWVIGAAFFTVGVGIFLPFSSLAHSLGFVPLPPLYFVVLLLLIVAYLTIVEIVKNIFLKKYNF